MAANIAQTSTVTIVYNLRSRIDIGTIVRKFVPSKKIYFLKWGKTEVRYYDKDPILLKRIQEKLKKDASKRKRQLVSLRKQKKEVQFFNQITLDIDAGQIKRNGKTISVYTNAMLYCNGKIKMTGCRDIESATNTVGIIIKLLSSMQGTHVVPLCVFDGLYYNELTGRVYSRNVLDPDGSGMMVMGKCIGFFGDVSKNPASKRKLGDGELFIYYDAIPSKYPQNVSGATTTTTDEISSTKSVSSTYTETIKFGHLKDSKIVSIKNDYLIDKCYNHDLVKMIYCKETLCVIGKKYIVLYDRNNKGLYYRNNGQFIYTTVKALEESTAKTHRIKFSIGTIKYNHTEYEAPNSVVRGEELYNIYDKFRRIIGEECIDFLSDPDPELEPEPEIKVENNDFTIEDFFAVSQDLCMHTPEYIKANLNICMLNKDFSCEYLIDRDAFINLIINEYGMETFFDSEKNNGVKFLYYMDGKCTCNKNHCKCKTTITVYTSGKILLSGSKSDEECNAAYMFIREIMEQHRDELEREE
jgi:hypothetical protein